jgi:hypothetical protein
MTIHEVKSAADKKEFLVFPLALYKNFPKWIRPLDKDVDNVFDPEKNKTFRHGEIIRWILKDHSNQTIGRVAAFIDQKTVKKGNEQPTGGMGLFECIEDKDAAFMLFEKCREWLQAKGMEAMDGPINFGSRDRWWGLLVDGFDREPNYQCNYNPPYYQNYFEEYGFKTYFNQFTFARRIKDPLSPKLAYKAELIAKEKDYEFRHLRKDEIKLLGEYLRTVYNKAWANRAENPEITAPQAALIVKQMKPILDEKLLYFGFYKGEPISFFLSLPEINQIFKHVNGQLNWLGKVSLVSAQKNKHQSFWNIVWRCTRTPRQRSRWGNDYGRSKSIARPIQKI